MTGWDELVAAALIGTDRRPVEAGVPEGSPAGLETALRERGAEDRLLGAAAAWTVARRAGAVVGDPVEVAPAEADPRPLAPGVALRDRLEGVYPSLLGEWLALAAQRGLRPPPELVPALLNRAALEPALYGAAGEAAGPLGRWLAERNPNWAFVRGAGDDVDAIWAEGASDERRALLERLRRADPAAGRALLAGTFADEAWEDRAAFVAALAHGLSDDDEPLLESALDDRRKPVRDAAAFLLAGLPRSRFAARMAARAAPLVRVEGRRLRGDRLVVELPAEPDAAAKRDGVASGGRRSERLHALLAATPLATWTGATTTTAPPSAAVPASPPAASPPPTTAPASPSAAVPASPPAASPPPTIAPASPSAAVPASPPAASPPPTIAPASPPAAVPASPPAAAPPSSMSAAAPASSPLPFAATAPISASELTALPVADDLAAVVHGGWADAAVAQRDAVWARALWTVHPDPVLLVALPRDEAEGLAAAADQPDVAASALVGGWGAALSKAVIDAIHGRRTAGERGPDVEFAGFRLDPAFATEAEERLRELGGRDVRRLCDILTAWAAMLRELS